MEALCWIDIETTGLVPDEGWILELAVIVTDIQLNELGRFRKYNFSFLNDYEDVEDLRGNSLEIIQEMHANSGLWIDLREQIENDLGYPRNDTEFDMSISDSLLQISENYNVEKYYPAGSSVHFDVDWLTFYCPRFAAGLSYRHLDVTTLKLATLCATGEYPSSTGDTSHRAVPDIEASLAWFKNYIFPAEGVSTQASHISKVIDNELEG